MTIRPRGTGSRGLSRQETLRWSWLELKGVKKGSDLSVIVTFRECHKDSQEGRRLQANNFREMVGWGWNGNWLADPGTATGSWTDTCVGY